MVDACGVAVVIVVVHVVVGAMGAGPIKLLPVSAPPEFLDINSINTTPPAPERLPNTSTETVTESLPLIDTELISVKST